MKPKYKVGDIVTHNIIVNRKENIECEFCNKGMIVARNKKKVMCPKCWGKSYIEKNIKKKEMSAPAEIVKITIYIRKNGESVWYSVKNPFSTFITYKVNEKNIIGLANSIELVGRHD